MEDVDEAEGDEDWVPEDATEDHLEDDDGDEDILFDDLSDEDDVINLLKMRTKSSRF